MRRDGEYDQVTVASQVGRQVKTPDSPLACVDSVTLANATSCVGVEEKGDLCDV